MGAFIDVNTNGYGFYLGTAYNADGSLYYRRHGTKNDGDMGTWQQLARITDNVASASKWATARSFRISDYSESMLGTSVNVDGSENIVLKMPSTGTFKVLSADSLSAANATISSLIATNGEIRNKLTFRNGGTATNNVVMEAMANGNLRFTAMVGTAASAIATFEAATAQLSLFRLYVGTALSLDVKSRLYGNINMVTPVQRCISTRITMCGFRMTAASV